MLEQSSNVKINVKSVFIQQVMRINSIPFQKHPYLKLGINRKILKTPIVRSITLLPNCSLSLSVLNTD